MDIEIKIELGLSLANIACFRRIKRPFVQILLIFLFLQRIFTKKDSSIEGNQSR